MRILLCALLIGSSFLITTLAGCGPASTSQGEAEEQLRKSAEYEATLPPVDDDDEEDED